MANQTNIHLVRQLDAARRQLEIEAALRRVRAQAQLELLLAGARVEDIRQAEAQVASADAQVKAAQVELASATADYERFASLVESDSGSEKQRDDAKTHRDLAAARLEAARQAATAARETLGRLRAGARREEIDTVRAGVALLNVHEITP